MSDKVVGLCISTQIFAVPHVQVASSLLCMLIVALNSSRTTRAPARHPCTWTSTNARQQQGHYSRSSCRRSRSRSSTRACPLPHPGPQQQQAQAATCSSLDSCLYRPSVTFVGRMATSCGSALTGTDVGQVMTHLAHHGVVHPAHPAHHGVVHLAHQEVPDLAHPAPGTGPGGAHLAYPQEARHPSATTATKSVTLQGSVRVWGGHCHATTVERWGTLRGSVRGAIFAISVGRWGTR